jgi:hypothetical protein
MHRVDPTSVFTKSIFTRGVGMASSPYIPAMHPKTEILPDPSAISKILAAGWVGQLKIHGHRVQIHISSDPKEPLVAYNRQGKPHAKELSAPMISELLRLFRPRKGWNVIDGEWLKPEEKIYIFDFLKREDEMLWLRSYPERWSLLSRAFLSPHLVVLPLLRDLPSCLRVLQGKDDGIEGLVFKSMTSTGFSDTSIVRCRRRK